jgi:AraC-like DNA-binding protein
MDERDAFFHYLPVNEKTMGSGIYVTGAGSAVIGPAEPYPPAGHPALYQFEWSRGRTLPEFQVVLVSDGAGEFDAEASGHVRFDGAALIFLFPGVWHRYRPDPATGWTERWISFNGQLVHQLFEVGLFGPRLAVATPRDVDRLADEMDEMLAAIHRRTTRHPAVLAFQALRIIADAVAHRLEDALDAGTVPEDVSAYSNLEDPLVRRALELIWSHSHYPMSVSDIARQLPVTRRTLDRRFVDATGHSVLEAINACRLSRAKRLLAETDLPVKTVAHLAGFSSTERMRVAFVEREGHSPTVFRKHASAARPAPLTRPATTEGG